MPRFSLYSCGTFLPDRSCVILHDVPDAMAIREGSDTLSLAHLTLRTSHNVSCRRVHMSSCVARIPVQSVQGRHVSWLRFPWCVPSGQLVHAAGVSAEPRVLTYDPGSQTGL